MLSVSRFRRGGVLGLLLGLSTLAALLFVAGCASNGSGQGNPFAVTTTSGQLATVVVNSVYPQTTLTAANGTGSLTWTITSGALPTGMTLSSAGVFSGTPTAYGTFNFIVQVTDSASPAHTATANLTVSINPAITSVALNPTTVPGGTPSTGTITLSGAAAAAATVTLSSNSVSAAVSATATVAAGATTGTFQVTTTAVSASTQATITATYGVAKNAVLTVNPPTVLSVVLTQSTVTGGTSTTGTITLSGPAATGGDSVTLGSDNAAAQVAATITVPAGQTSALINVTTSSVSSSATAHIQATFNSTSQSATLTVVPAPTITSFGPSPTSITAGASTKLTAVFSNGTGSVNNGVGAISSGGTGVSVAPAATTIYTLTVTNAAGTSVTAQATVTVVPAPVITSFTSLAATITAGTSTKLTAVFNPGPNGTATVDNGVGAVNSGQQVTVSPATTTTYTLTVANSATTPATTTATVTVTVVPAPVITSFTPGSATIVSGSTTTLTAVFSNGTGSVDNGVGPVNNNQQVTIGPTTTTTYTLTVTNAATTPASVTAMTTVTVNAPPHVTLNPTNQTAAAGSNATFTAAASGNPAPTVQWAVSTGGGPFTNISGATSTTLTLTGVTTGQNGNQYQAVFTNSLGSVATSAATLTVTTAPAITLSPSNQTVTAGNNATFTAAASGTPTPTVQWQVSVSGGAFANISGATATTLTLTAVTAAQNGNKYQAVFTNSFGNATTTSAILTVNFAPTITQNPVSQSAAAGGSANFTAAASGNPTPTVQWQVSTDGGTSFSNISGATSSTLTLMGVTTVQNGNQYHAMFTNSLGSVTTSAATLTVTNAPVITLNPSSQTVTAGNNATFTAAASGTPAPTVQWQVSTDGGTTFTNISGATSTTLSLTAVTVSQNANQYRAVFTNSVNSATTSAATLTVDAPPGISSNASTTFTIGQNGNFTVQGTGNPPPTFIESGALPSGVSFVDNLNGTATLSGIPAAGSATTYTFTITAHNGIGTDATQSFTLTVVNDPCATIVGGSEAFLTGHYAFLLRGFDNGQGTGETMPEPALVGGVLTFNGTNNNGLISAGTLDMNLNGTGGIQSQSVTGTYKVGSDQRGCMAITSSTGTQHYRFSLGNITSGVAWTGHMIDFDSAGPFTAGTLRKQDTTAFSTSKVTGNYAYEITSPQNTAPSAGGKQAAAGVIKLSNGNVTGGEFDINDEGALEGNSTLTAWPSSAGFTYNSGTSYSIDGASGRGLLNVSVTINGTAQAFQNVIYVVSAGDFLAITNFDQTQTGGLVGTGEALLQASGSFSSSSVNAPSILHISSLQLNGGYGSTTPPTASTQIGRITSAGSGTINFFAWQVSPGNSTNPIKSQSGNNISIQVAGNGRVLCPSCGNHPPVFWLIAPNEGFFLGGSPDVETGMFEPQTSTTTTSGVPPYAFGAVNPEVPGVDDDSGVATFTASTVSGTTDDNSNGSPSPDGTFGPQNSSVDGTGLGSISSGSSACTIGVTGTSGCQLIFYVISPTRAVLMQLLNNNNNVTGKPSLQIADK